MDTEIVMSGVIVKGMGWPILLELSDSDPKQAFENLETR